jgi:hypothetical protein
VVLTTQKDKSALPIKETSFQHLPVCINKGSLEIEWDGGPRLVPIQLGQMESRGNL